MKPLLLLILSLTFASGDDSLQSSSYQMHLCRHYETQFKKAAKEGSAYAKTGDLAKANTIKIKAVEYMKELQKCDQEYLSIKKDFLAETIKMAEKEIAQYEQQHP